MLSMHSPVENAVVGCWWTLHNITATTTPCMSAGGRYLHGTGKAADGRLVAVKHQPISVLPA